jgi:D-threo-aldose 1-dehydrogenase
MESTALGTTGVRVTRLGLGCAPLGNLFRAIGDDRARATVDAAWKSGIRYFDTAPHYGLGLSERRLGDALGDRPRDGFTVSTKVGRRLVPNPAPTGSDLAAGFDVPDTLARRFDFTADGVRRSLEESLQRLGLDRVDVLYVHDPDDFVEQAIREAVPALARLRDEGVVGAVGVGMNAVAPLRRFVAEADIDVIMVAG